MTPLPPRIVVTEAADLPRAGEAARRVFTGRFARTRGLRFLEISALPWLRSSPEGAAFVALGAPRAVARGTPAEFCPAAGVSSPGATDAAGASREALNTCIAQLRTRGADPDCGCRLMAVNDAVLAPRDNFAFAPGVAARVLDGEGRSAGLLVAESRPTPEGERVKLLSPQGDVAILLLSGNDAELVLVDQPETIWRGTRRAFGYRRGRLAERVELQSESGERMSVLIGVERRDADPAG
ncbi:MAG: hypothetical protein AAF401_19135 [Pseudomonadota bacterium]